MSGLPAPVAVFAPGEEVTVYDVTGAPPLETGALKLTLACVSPGAAVTAVGGAGTVRGVTAAEGADAAPSPATLCAVTVNV